MVELTIALSDCDESECCALCGKRLAAAAGPRLVQADGREAVCRDCGSRHAPSLAALLELAQVARRVGRIGRHTLVPPLGALLDLARAAERYMDTTPKGLARAA